MALPAKQKPRFAALLTRRPECCIINYNEFFLHIEDQAKGYPQAWVAFNKICYLANMIVLHIVVVVVVVYFQQQHKTIYIIIIIAKVCL